MSPRTRIRALPLNAWLIGGSGASHLQHPDVTAGTGSTSAFYLTMLMARAEHIPSLAVAEEW